MSFLSDFLTKVFAKKEKGAYINLPTAGPFRQNFDPEKTMQIDMKPFKQHYIIKVNGEYSVFDSKDEMPDEFREGVELMEHSDSVDSSYIVLVHGKRKTYSAYEEMPEEIRTAIENARVQS